MANHPNVVALKESWVKKAPKPSVKPWRLYVVMEYLPKTLDSQIQLYWWKNTTTPALLIKVFTFQMFRGLNYLHTIRIWHRDIKPSNLLVDPDSGVLKVCDFGCAKLVRRPGSKNRAYVCSRYYRAPELALRNPYNEESIDVWAGACVLAECFRGWPLFPGKNSRHQFGAVAKVLGNPLADDVFFLNPSLLRMDVKAREASGTFSEHFPDGTPDEALDLMSRTMVYIPKNRVTALEACAHEYYDQLRLEWKTIKLPSGAPLPPIFQFTPQELEKAPSGLIHSLLPENHGNEAITRYMQGRPEPYNRLSSISGSETSSMDSTGSEGEISEVYSEAASSDVEEHFLWNCQKLQPLMDEESADLETLDDTDTGTHQNR